MSQNIWFLFLKVPRICNVACVYASAERCFFSFFFLISFIVFSASVIKITVDQPLDLNTTKSSTRQFRGQLSPRLTVWALVIIHFNTLGNQFQETVVSFNIVSSLA